MLHGKVERGVSFTPFDVRIPIDTIKDKQDLIAALTIIKDDFTANTRIKSFAANLLFDIEKLK